MARWRNYFSQLLNLREDKDVRQAEIHTVETLVPEPSAFEVELAIGKLKNHKSPGTDQIPVELINPLNTELNPICHLLALLGVHHILHLSRIRVKAGGRTICCTIHKLIISIWNKEELPEEWKESIIVPFYKKGDKTD